MSSMGIINFIRRLFGADYDKKVRNLNSRIYDLKNEAVKAEKEIEKFKGRNIKTHSFLLAPKISNIEVKAFSPFKLKRGRTMKDLLQARKEQEIERIKLLKQQIATNFGTIEKNSNKKM